MCTLAYGTKLLIKISIMKNSQKGFTLIELLVVIAIIGILATIVLTSLGSAQNKAKDSKISGQLSSMRAQAQLATATGAFTGGVCATTSSTLFDASTGVGGLLAGLTLGTTTATSACVSDGTAPSSGGKWAAAIKLSNNAYACADYTGTSRTTTSTSLTTAGVAGGSTSAMDLTTMTCTTL